MVGHLIEAVADGPAQLGAAITGLRQHRLGVVVVTFKSGTDKLDLQGLESRQSVCEVFPLEESYGVVVVGSGNVDLQRFLVSQARQRLAGSLEESEGPGQDITDQDGLDDEVIIIIIIIINIFFFLMSIVPDALLQITPIWL